jgi:hypothetical protein
LLYSGGKAAIVWVWNRLLEELIVAQTGKKYPACCGN